MRLITVAVALLASVCTCRLALADRPNVLVILADDMGVGDVSALAPEGKITTPNLDKLAAAGMVFTDAHSSSAVCTPTRYNLLTGRYNWRSRMKKGVLYGESPRLIEPGRLTIAELLKRHGYATACFGKWHLGLDWVRTDGKQVDYTQPFANGPTTLGFDVYFGIVASLDMPPYTWLEQDRVAAQPTATKTWIRPGPAAPDFEAIDVLPTLGEKVVQYIARRAADAKAGKPFFVYVPLASPHTPILPTQAFQGRSRLNAYGDFVMETDAVVGRMLAALDGHGLTENTLVIFTADNGCAPLADTKELESKGHFASGPYRGYKADAFEGGHRVPFIARWPGKIKPGTRSEQTIVLGDLMATLAEVLAVKLPDDAGEDSVSILPALLGSADKPLREAAVHHSVNGTFAIRQGPWKLILAPDSGGWSDPRPRSKGVADLPPVQLFNLAEDPGEQTNLQAGHPQIVERLTALLQKYVDDGRSTPGEKQENTGEVIIR